MRVYLREEKFAGRFANLLLEIGNGDYPSFDEMITTYSRKFLHICNYGSRFNIKNLSRYCSYT